MPRPGVLLALIARQCGRVGVWRAGPKESEPSDGGVCDADTEESDDGAAEAKEGAPPKSTGPYDAETEDDDEEEEEDDEEEEERPRQR